MDIPAVYKVLDTGEEGLSQGHVSERIKRFGANVITERRPYTKTKIILNQLKSPLILILIIAGCVTGFLRETGNTIVIFAAVFANTLLGFWQENKAEHALELLKSYIRTRARVRREGIEHEIDASELAPGDIIRIKQGDRVPADARLLFVNMLEVDESVLTGESLPVEKNPAAVGDAASLANRSSCVYSGTMVVRGFADAVVTTTGSRTEFGKIALLVASRDRTLTPLQRSVAGFARMVGIILIVLTILVFSLGVYVGYDLLDMFLITVAIAVSAVPEGLPVALTVILAVGVVRLAKKKGVVRRLLAAETLGSTTLILTDKTGTLTQAKMELVDVVPIEGHDKEARARLLTEALYNVDVVIENPSEEPPQWRMFGDSLEMALVAGAASEGVLLSHITKEATIVDRRPFSSESKFTVTVTHRRRDEKQHISVLGAPEIVLEFTTLPAEMKRVIRGIIDEQAGSGKRVLGVASKENPHASEVIHGKDPMNGYAFEGLLLLHDPLRPSVKHAIHRIRDQGVKTVIVTGDHKGTAESVAHELGLIDGEGRVLTGEELAAIPPGALAARIGDVAVFARVSPEQKMQLVKAYRERGEVVASTGDGINDAPALKTADIGVAVGSGTDVTKSAADLVILDDNLETLVAAIEEGRKILQNIRKVIVYLLSDSLDEILLIGGALLTGIPLPINALQILYVNFFSDSFPAIAFAFEDSADQKTRRIPKLHTRLFDKSMRFFIFLIGIPTSMLLFVIYYALLRYGFDEELVRTFIFASFSSYTLLITFSIRSFSKSILTYNPFSNYFLTAGVALGLVLTAAAIYARPLQFVLGTVSLPPLWLLGVLGFGMLNIAITEAGKRLLRWRGYE